MEVGSGRPGIGKSCWLTTTCHNHKIFHQISVTTSTLLNSAGIHVDFYEKSLALPKSTSPAVRLGGTWGSGTCFSLICPKTGCRNVTLKYPQHSTSNVTYMTEEWTGIRWDKYPGLNFYYGVEDSFCTEASKFLTSAITKWWFSTTRGLRKMTTWYCYKMKIGFYHEVTWRENSTTTKWRLVFIIKLLEGDTLPLQNEDWFFYAFLIRLLEGKASILQNDDSHHLLHITRLIFLPWPISPAPSGRNSHPSRIDTLCLVLSSASWQPIKPSKSQHFVYPYLPLSTRIYPYHSISMKSIGLISDP